MAKFANILETVGKTPVVKVSKLAPAGINLYVKVEAFNPLGSVKDRLALGIIEDAERRGALKPGQTVIEATSGSTAPSANCSSRSGADALPAACFWPARANAVPFGKTNPSEPTQQEQRWQHRQHRAGQQHNA